MCVCGCVCLSDVCVCVRVCLPPETGRGGFERRFHSISSRSQPVKGKIYFSQE